jgi:hypothetical protein
MFACVRESDSQSVCLSVGLWICGFGILTPCRMATRRTQTSGSRRRPCRQSRRVAAVRSESFAWLINTTKEQISQSLSPLRLKHPPTQKLQRRCCITASLRHCSIRRTADRTASAPPRTSRAQRVRTQAVLRERARAGVQRGKLTPCRMATRRTQTSGRPCQRSRVRGGSQIRVIHLADKCSSFPFPVSLPRFFPSPIL